jgi:rpsU-divergently transcribed protein
MYITYLKEKRHLELIIVFASSHKIEKAMKSSSTILARRVLAPANKSPSLLRQPFGRRLSSSSGVVAPTSSSPPLFFDPKSSRAISKNNLGRNFATATIEADQISSNSSNGNDMVSHKEKLLQATLRQVPTKGFTQEAITAAVLEHPHWSLTMAGMITPSELVSYCMNTWNDEMQAHGPFDSEMDALKFRLERILPVKSQWHNAMVMGASSQPFETREQVHRIIELASPGASMTRQAALGVIYVTTELHFLADSSEGHQDTWAFLQQRLQELDSGSLPLPEISSVQLEASSAVARSLFDGLISVINPPSTYSSKIPGTNPDYYRGKATKPAPTNK